MIQPTARGNRALYADLVGGITTFFTMAYIVVVNPAILSTDGTGMPFAGAMTATVLVASTMTLLMGIYARLPFAVAPGMGLNAFFAYTIVLQNHVPWQTALGMVFWAGVLFLLVSATRLREHVAMAIPPAHRIPQRRPDCRRSVDHRAPRYARSPRRFPADGHRCRGRPAAAPKPVRVSR